MRRKVQPEHLDRAGRRGDQAEQHLDRRRLPGSVRTEQAKDFARLDRKGDTVHGGKIAEPLTQIRGLKDRRRHRHALFDTLKSQQLFDLFREMADLALSLDHLALILSLSIMTSKTIVERPGSERRPFRMVRIPGLAVG